MSRHIRVLVVDDSVLCRNLLSSIISRARGVEVVGSAANGLEAIRMNRDLAPDIITMDINMPGLNGFDTIKRIMSDLPVPILVITSAPSPDGEDQAYRAVSAGALDLLKKDNLNGIELLEKIRTLSAIQVTSLRFQHPASAEPAASTTAKQRVRLITIASSSGGPTTVLKLLKELPAKLPATILLTQHLPDDFSASFARWLNREVNLAVEEAIDNTPISPGHVYVAPGGHHLTIWPDGRLHLSNDPPVMNLKPSGDVMFKSAARSFGRRVMGIVLTGMGQDGSEGLAAIGRAGGLRIAQDEVSSLVFGMPKAAIEAKVVDQVLDIQGIAKAIMQNAGDGK